MAQITGSIVVGPNDQFVTLFNPEGTPPLRTIPGSHPNFDQIRAAVTAAADEGSPIDPSIIDLLDIEGTVRTGFERLSRRFTVLDGIVYFDQEPVDNLLTEHLLRLLADGEDFSSVVNFAEKLYGSEDVIGKEENSVLAGDSLDQSKDDIVSQVFGWLRANGLFTLTPDGDIVGYKGVTTDGNGGFTSIQQGTAIVNGKEVTGRIPYKVGDVVEMPRTAVQQDPRVGCSTGLHVGTHEYASSFGGGVCLEVHVDARDIVSVPTECGSAKMRCCRFNIVGTVEAKYDSPVLSDYEDAEDDLDNGDWL